MIYACVCTKKSIKCTYKVQKTKSLCYGVEITNPSIIAAVSKTPWPLWTM